MLWSVYLFFIQLFSSLSYNYYIRLIDFVENGIKFSNGIFIIYKMAKIMAFGMKVIIYYEVIIKKVQPFLIFINFNKK